MRLLIVGGTGLISTAITRQALERGWSVTHLNRGQTPTRVAGEVPVLKVDRRDREAFEAAVRRGGPWDGVIDMIGYTPDDAQSLMRACEGVCGHLVFCSTVDVYDKKHARYPTRPEDAYGGLTQYGRDKEACERIVLSDASLAATVIRPAATYGEGGSIIHSLGWSTSFLDRMRRGLPVILHGDGESLWSMLHVDDIAPVFLNAVGNLRAIGRIYNATALDPMSWRQYHERLAKAIGGPAPKVVRIPSDVLAALTPRADISLYNFQYSNVFDNSLTQRDLGLAPRVGWEEGARRTYEWLELHGRIETAESDAEYASVLDRWAKGRVAMGLA